ncbi:MAG: FKBP-type peptidyl-prolyl cis-trans isomerase [Candidatus Zixiibacteriota bacterium]|nr:MAG: FKBP-type peptidyl-prolyl cis-trans isomerase [candidate division Zixibacteria bacterium]
MIRITGLLLGILLVSAGLVLGGDSTKTETKAEPAEKTEAAPDSAKKVKKPEFITTESGLKYADLVVGEGKEAVNGMQVECHYTLWIADENDEPGQKLQSSKDMGRTFEFKVGGPLIKGWNEGMLGMKEGGTRMLIIPPELGYGNSPPPGSGIPKDKNLIFKIEFLKAK